jgi:hypothetical protein
VSGLGGLLFVRCFLGSEVRLGSCPSGEGAEAPECGGWRVGFLRQPHVASLDTKYAESSHIVI